MQEKTEIYMTKNHMTVPKDGVLVGLSGGADSVALLLLLWKLRDKLNISLRAIHIHHGLRGTEADRDAAFSRNLCEQLRVPFYECRIDVSREAREGGYSVEEAGRKARYRLYEETALSWEQEMHKDEGNRSVVHIATAHHADDNAETILLNLFRGSGLLGLSGIQPVRGRIIRPILWAERSEIKAWLLQCGQEWVEDSTNQESEYSRNWIRNEMLPAVRKRLNTQAAKHIGQAGKYIRQADAYFEDMAKRWIEINAPDGKADAGKLLREADIIQGYVIRKLFEKNKMPLKDVTEKHIESVRQLLKQNTGKSVSLPHGFKAVNTYGIVEILPDGQKSDRLHEHEIRNTLNEEILQMRTFPCENPNGFPKNQYTKWFDYDKIKNDLSLRHRQPGDYFILPLGGRKTLKSWMIDEKIPRSFRDEIWLLAEGNHILWIVGYRISDYYKITKETKTILEVEFNGGKSSV